MPPFLIRTHIPLAGEDLANNHTFKLLSGLLRQTLSGNTIAPHWGSVNGKSLPNVGDGTEAVPYKNS